MNKRESEFKRLRLNLYTLTRQWFYYTSFQQDMLIYVKERKHIKSDLKPPNLIMVSWLVVFYGIPTLVGYLILNSVQTYVKCVGFLNS